jgi:hypothetical protein
MDKFWQGFLWGAAVLAIGAMALRRLELRSRFGIDTGVIFGTRSRVTTDADVQAIR